MSHYFTTQGNETKSNPIRIAFRAHGQSFTCETDHGVFSRLNLDRGTKVLLDFLALGLSIIRMAFPVENNSSFSQLLISNLLLETRLFWD